MNTEISTKINKHLINRLENCSKYTPSELEKNLFRKTNLKDFLYLKITSKRYRKTKLFTENIPRIYKAIDIAIQNDLPIKFVWPLGAFKLWRLDAYPEVDWAEFFNIAYICEYMAQIAVFYKPGVEMNYYLHTYPMSLYNNYPEKDIESYVESFTFLIHKFREYLPKNIQLKIVKDSDFYTKEEFVQEINDSLDISKQELKNFEPERIDHLERSAKLCMNIKGKEDLTNLSEPKMQDKWEKSLIYENALYHLRKAIEFYLSPDKIIIFSQPKKETLGIGSTKSSIVKFWLGVGILQENKNNYLDVILSPAQWERLKDQSKIYKVNFFNLKNFKEVRFIKNIY